jgi:hypothetical protein
MEEILGINYKVIEVNENFYDYIAVHENGNKYIEYNNCLLNDLEYFHNSEIYQEFEMNESSDLKVYSEFGDQIDRFTVFLVPNNSSSNTIVIFETTKSKLLENYYDWLFLSKDYIKEIIDSHSNFINCIDSEINLSKFPPILLNSSTQSLLNNLAIYLPNKDFVLHRRWETDEMFFDEVYKTCEKSINYGLDEKLVNFPGSDKCDISIWNEWEVYYHQPDSFGLFEKSVWDSLNIKGDRLELTSEKYNIKPNIIF